MSHDYFLVIFLLNGPNQVQIRVAFDFEFFLCYKSNNCYLGLIN